MGEHAPAMHHLKTASWQSQPYIGATIPVVKSKLVSQLGRLPLDRETSQPQSDRYN